MAYEGNGVAAPSATTTTSVDERLLAAAKRLRAERAAQTQEPIAPLGDRQPIGSAAPEPYMIGPVAKGVERPLASDKNFSSPADYILDLLAGSGGRELQTVGPSEPVKAPEPDGEMDLDLTPDPTGLRHIVDKQPREEEEQGGQEAERVEASRADLIDKALNDIIKGKRNIREVRYENLNDERRAAVDLNTLMYLAAERDKELWKDYRNPEKAEQRNLEPIPDDYVEEFEAVFGEGAKGSKRYAPNMIDLLNSINYETEDLRVKDFLKLRPGVATTELGGFSLDPGDQTGLTGSEKLRRSIQADLVNTFTQAQEKGGERLKSLQRDLLGIDDMPGYKTEEVGKGETSRENQRTAFFQDALSNLSMASKWDKGGAGFDNDLAEIQRVLSNEQEFLDFLKFVDIRTKEAAQYGEAIVPDLTQDGERVRQVLPQRLRNRLGL